MIFLKNKPNPNPYNKTKPQTLKPKQQIQVSICFSVSQFKDSGLIC